MIEYAINNETTQGVDLPPFLINNLIYWRYDAMTKKIIPLSESESQDVPLCKCGCGGKVEYSKTYPRHWNTFIWGHSSRGVFRSKETLKRMSEAQMGKKHSKQTIAKIAKANMNPSDEIRCKISEASRNPSDETRRKLSIASNRLALKKLEKRQLNNLTVKGGYCDVWGDSSYINDLRKKACEQCGVSNMMSLKLFGTKLCTHHMNGKLNCAPTDIQTLCSSCHMKLHRRLQLELKLTI